MARIHLIDCGLGNLMSVSNAFESLGCDIIRCTLPSDLDGCEHIVLPGVGAFGDGIRKLKENGLDKAVVSAARASARLLGICLGMQLLFDKSYEFGENEGLHLIPGEVHKMDTGVSCFRLPHIGWNDTFLVKNDPLFEGIRNPAYFYYVNSFSCICADREHILGEYEYGRRYCSIVRKDNIFGVQFHPEKSQKDGLGLLKRFVGI
jgi:glutamine amidotransferase